MPLFERALAYNDPEQVQAAGIYPYFRPISGYDGNYVIVEGKRILMVGSNNYLGLSHHPEVLQAAHEALSTYGSGCTGSRFLNGNMDLHNRMEEALARFLNKEACVVFTTGFLANQGTLSTLTTRQSIIFSDRENHASIMEGIGASMAKLVRYKHNDMADLERLLERHKDTDEKLIVTDGVFSMTGAVVHLPQLVELAQRYGARIYLDDAHGLGVLGPAGRGTAEHFGMEDSVDLIMGTFSKSLASIGGYVAGPQKVISYIKHKARSLIFCASIPPASVAAALKCLEILERQPELARRLHENTQRAREGLASIGYQVGHSSSAIVPITLSGDLSFTFSFAQALFDEGLFSTPVVPPAVPPGTALIRTSYMASHTPEEIDTAIAIFEKVGRKLGVLVPKRISVPRTTDASLGGVNAHAIPAP